MPDAHSRYSASASARWLTCPGSIFLTEKIPGSGSSKYAAEGTAAHNLAEMCLRTGRDASDFLDEELQVEDYEFTVDEAFADAVQVYLDIVRGYAQGAIYAGYEKQVNYAGYIGAEDGEAFGTSDTVILKKDLLIIADLKFGRGGKVDAADNSQLALYGLGALDMIENDLVLCEHMPKRVLMVISQPRVVKAPLEWEVSVEELRAMAPEFRAAVERCIDARLEWADTPEWWAKFTRATEKGCQYCKRDATCPTSRADVTRTTHKGVPASPEEFADMDTVQVSEATEAAWLGATFLKLERVEDWCKNVRAEIERRNFAGETVPNTKVVLGKKPNRTWDDPEAVEAALKAMRLKHEQMYTYKLIGPAGAEKLAKVTKAAEKEGVKPALGKRQWATLQGMIKQSEARPHVVHADDPRPAVEVKPAVEEFDVIDDDPADQFADLL